MNNLIKKIIKEEWSSGYYGSSFRPVKSQYINEPNFREIVNKNVTKGSNLIIHPDDRTTDFLTPCYQNVDGRLITNTREIFNLRENMRQHDRIIMMGHGSPSGLMMPSITIKGVDSVNGELMYYNFYNLGYEFVDILKTKPIVAVWCNADKFVVPHDLHGFYTGMVISEMCEANYCNVHGCDVNQLEESNTLFTKALTVAMGIRSPQSVDVFKEIYNNPSNPIMVYNRQRIYYR